MAIKTIQEIAAEGRMRAGSGSTATMKAEIGKLRAENAVLARMVIAQGKKVPDGVNSSQLAGIVMCSAVEVDASDIEQQFGVRVIAAVGIDEDSFEVHVKLSAVSDVGSDPSPGNPGLRCVDGASALSKADMEMPPVPVNPDSIAGECDLSKEKSASDPPPPPLETH